MALRTKNKPVRPTAPRQHGFFGVQFFKSHLMMDEQWEPGCLTNQFKYMAGVMEKHFQFKKHENADFKKHYVLESRSLKKQCHDGRIKLQNALHTTNSKKIRNYLMNYKDMQRLYHAMPIHLVVDNINQKTFVLRKERDRLRYKLNQLVVVYEEKLKEKADLESRIKYQNEFVLDEENQSKQIRNKIELSNVRLNAIKTLNDSYKKIIQLLMHDEIYYEPILRSLQKDIDDQHQFSNYIIELGLPAITRLKDITEQHRKLEDKVRRNIGAKLQWVQNYKRRASQRQADLRKLQVKGEEPIDYYKRYVRETKSMLELKWELESMEATIKRVKFATLCSKATEVYPRIKKQIVDNVKLRRALEGDMVVTKYSEKEMGLVGEMRCILKATMTKEEMRRIETINELKKRIHMAKDTENKAIKHLQDRGEILCFLRQTLWSFNEILRHVLRMHKSVPRQYPTTDLELPLLKFENYVLKAFPPRAYEESLNNLMQSFKKKVTALMAAYKEPMSKEEIENCAKLYHEQFLASLDIEDDWSERESESQIEEQSDDRKVSQSVPTRKYLKQASADLVEEFAKKDE